jgi:DNA polymerase-3 subunit epsilon
VTSWRAARFVAVDVETTGLNPRLDEVLSFAAVPVEGGRVLVGQAVAGLVRPEARPSPASVEVHGLRQADLAAAAPAPEAFAPLVAELEGRIPVAHAAWIEHDFLRPRLRPLGFRMPRGLVDTALLWRLLSIRRRDVDPGWRALAAIAAELGLPSHRPHVATGDALTTAQVFLALATHLEADGRGTVRGLLGARWDLRAHRLWHPPFRSG